jgi:hypothetical protein
MATLVLSLLVDLTPVLFGDWILEDVIVMRCVWYGAEYIRKARVRGFGNGYLLFFRGVYRHFVVDSLAE